MLMLCMATCMYAQKTITAVDELKNFYNISDLPSYRSDTYSAQVSSYDTTGGNNDGFEWTDLAVFLFFAVPIAGRIASGILGRKFGSLATGGVVGVLAWIFTSSLIVAGLAVLVGTVFALVASLGSLGSGRRSSGGWTSGGFSTGGGGWSSGSSSDGGGFSSGGGGDFGGGGASGDW